MNNERSGRLLLRQQAQNLETLGGTSQDQAARRLRWGSPFPARAVPLEARPSVPQQSLPGSAHQDRQSRHGRLLRRAQREPTRRVARLRRLRRNVFAIRRPARRWRGRKLLHSPRILSRYNAAKASPLLREGRQRPSISATGITPSRLFVRKHSSASFRSLRGKQTLFNGCHFLDPCSENSSARTDAGRGCPQHPIEHEKDIGHRGGNHGALDIQNKSLVKFILARGGERLHIWPVIASLPPTKHRNAPDPRYCRSARLA